MPARHRAGRPPAAATPGPGLTDTPGSGRRWPGRSPPPRAGAGTAGSRPRSRPASRRRRSAGSWPGTVRRRMFPNDAGDMACFCSALIVGRLAPFGSRNTRFRSVPVSCGPRTGADASGPRHETRRNVAGPRSLGSRKGLRRRTSPVLYAPSAPSAMALPHGSPAVRPGEACRIPRPRWRTRGRCAARHGRNGARDRPRRHARRPMMSPVPAPAAPAPLVSMAVAHARPAIPRADTSAANAVQPNEPSAMRTQAMPATCGRFGAPRLELASHEAGPAARAPRRPGGDGRPAAAHAADSRFPHDARHPAATGPGRIPAPRRRPGARLAAPVHGHEGTGMGPEDAAVDWLQCVRQFDGGRLT